MITTANKYTYQTPHIAVIKPRDMFLLMSDESKVQGHVRADQVLISTQTGNFEWDAFKEYTEGNIVTYKGRIWEASNLVGNVNKIPTEGIWWSEQSKSAAGFVLHQHGYFFEDDVYVLKELDGKLQLFRLDPNLTRPFHSQNFFQEFAAGNWKLASETGYIVIEKTQHGWTEDTWITIKDGDWALCGPTETGLGKISLVADNDHVILHLKTKVMEGFVDLVTFTTYYHAADGSLTATPNGNPAVIAIDSDKAIAFPGSGSGGGGGSVPTLAQVLAAGSDGGGHQVSNMFFDASAIVSGVIDVARLPASAFQSVYTYTGAQTLPQNAGLTIAQVQNGDIVIMQTAGTQYVVVDDTQLNAAGGYTPYTMSTAWDSITNKPTFGNGITYSAGTPGTVRLGGPLLANTSILGANFSLDLGTLASKLSAGSVHANSFGIHTYTGLNARTSLAGISDKATDSTYTNTVVDSASEANGTLVKFSLLRPLSGETARITNSTGNADPASIKDLLTLERTLAAGTAGANGIGARLVFDIKNSVAAGGDAPKVGISYSLTNVTQNLESGKYSFSLHKLGAETSMLEVDVNGARYLADLSLGYTAHSLITRDYLLTTTKTFSAHQTFSAGISLPSLTNTHFIYAGVGGVLTANDAVRFDGFGVLAKRLLIQGSSANSPVLDIQTPGNGTSLGITQVASEQRMIFRPRPTTANGDIYFRGADSYLDRLAIGPVGYTLTVSSTGYPQWTASGLLTLNRQIASYPLELTDIGKVIEMNMAAPNIVTVPTNTEVAIPIGATFIVAQYGTGQTTITPSTGVTLRSSSATYTTPGQYATVTLVKIAANEWYLWNGLAGSGAGGGVTMIADAGQIPVSDGVNLVGYPELIWVDATKNLAINGCRIYSHVANGNLFFGNLAGNFTMTGTENMGIGKNTIQDLTTATGVTAFGMNAGKDVTTGNYSNFFGNASGATITTGGLNNAFGVSALGGPGLGASSENAAFGYFTLFAATGSKNAAFGNGAGISVTSGLGNSFFGWKAGDNVTTGSKNLVLGYNLNALNPTADGQLNIQNVIYGTGNTAEDATISTGKIGFGVQLPDRRVHVSDLFSSSAVIETPFRVTSLSTSGTLSHFGSGVEFSAQLGSFGATPKVLGTVGMAGLSFTVGAETSRFKVATLVAGALANVFQVDYRGAGINADPLDNVALNAVASINAAQEIRMSNTNAFSAAHAVFNAKAVGGDAYSQYEVAATQWVSGLDNSDADKYKVSRGTILGVNDALVIDPISLAIGAGTSAPAARFHVSGTFRVDLGSDAAGDMYFRSAGGHMERLGAGTNGHVVTMVAGLPAWAAPSGGGGSSNPAGGAASEMQKNDGAGAFAGTSLFSLSAGNFQMGAATTTGTARTFTVNGSGDHIGFKFTPKGIGSISFGSNTEYLGIGPFHPSWIEINAIGKHMYFGASGGKNIGIGALGNNIGIFGLPAFSGSQVIFIGNAATIPATNPVAGVYVYVNDGALWARGRSGSTRELCPA